MTTYRFEQPWYLLLLAAAVLVLLWRPRRGGTAFGAYRFATLALRASFGPLVLRLLGAASLACFAIAIARPQHGQTLTERPQSGRELLLVIDLSLSMTIRDIASGNQKIDRLAAVMDAADRFIAGRGGDRIGLVFFGSRAIASCPPTFDHVAVREFLTRTQRLQRRLWGDADRAEGDKGLLGDGTNLGLGIGTALRWLGDGEQRAMVLITDGKDSRELPGWVDPIVMSETAAKRGVRVHCIGVGSVGGTATIQDAWGNEREVRIRANLLPDPQRLEAIANAAGGVALSASDGEDLKRVFAEIERLEPSDHRVVTRDDYHDRFLSWLIAATCCAALAFAVDVRLRGLA